MECAVEASGGAARAPEQAEEQCFSHPILTDGLLVGSTSTAAAPLDGRDRTKAQPTATPKARAMNTTMHAKPSSVDSEMTLDSRISSEGHDTAIHGIGVYSFAVAPH